LRGAIVAAKGLTISFPTRDLINLTKEAQLALHNETAKVLETLGEGLLAKVQQAYVDKGRGDTGSDGIKWEPLQLGSLLARQRRSGRLVDPGEKDAKHVTPTKTKGVGRLHKVNKVHKADADLYQQAIDAGALKVISGGKTKNKSGEDVFKKGTIFGVMRGKDGSTKEALKKRISPGSGGYQIGVDTGLQIGTLQPGKSGTAGPSLEYTPGAVTVAAAMTYSPHFDKLRPIMSEHIPPAWLDELEELVIDHGAKVLETVFK
jgi:hypothetical protein